nr:3'-5' exonuclease [Bifidobacterium ramosum]
MLRAFLDQLESLRTFATTHPVDELLWRVYTQTGWYDYCGQLPDGYQRQANLAQLCAKARTFAGTGARGIPAFLKAVEQWQTNDNKDVNAEAVTLSTKDAVHLTSIHQAKGLQWKVVILADATSDTYRTNQLSQFVTVQKPGDPEHGVAVCKIADERSQSVVGTFQYDRLTGMVRRQTVDEQLRLLYVALTRPERKLIIAGISASEIADLLVDAQAKAQMLRDDNTVTADGIVNGNKYLTWILQALYAASRHTEAQGTNEFRAYLNESNADAGPVFEGFLPLPDGLAADTMAGNASVRRVTLLHDLTDVHTHAQAAGSERNVQESAALKMRPSPEGFVSVDERVPVECRRPLTINASGVRSWAELTAPVEPGDDDDAASSAVSGESVVRDDADERSWRFSSYPLPDFLTDAGHSPSAAEIGTGVHNVLEQFHWSTPPDAAACAEQLRKVIHRLEMTQVISAAAACQIEQGPLFDGMMWFVCPDDETADGDGTVDAGASLPAGIRSHRGRLFREAPFSLLLDDRELRRIANPNGSHGSGEFGSAQDGEVSADAGIVVRGVIDGYYVDDETRSIVLFDYKTDAVWDEEHDDLAHWERRLHDDYVGQQALYAKALERLYPGYTVTQRWLVGLAGHRFINVAR